MEIERFKSKLTKTQIEGMATDLRDNYMDTASALDGLDFSKKLLYFAAELNKGMEVSAKLVWDQEKDNYPNMNYTQGGTIYDLEKDPVYNDLKSQLSARTELLKLAVKRKEPIFDEEGVEVPKVPIKGYRKDSINVKI